MNKLKTIICVISAGLAASVASAISINGNIAFEGSTNIDAGIPTATNFSSFTNVEVAVGTQTGDYFGTAGTAVTMAPIQFAPFALPGSPLWTFTSGPTTYSFDLLSLSSYDVIDLGGGLYTLTISGLGMASITGFDDTEGAFSLTTTGSGTATDLGFGAFTFVPPPTTTVSDSGTTVALLGVAMLGFVIVRRRNRAMA